MDRDAREGTGDVGTDAIPRPAIPRRALRPSAGIAGFLGAFAAIGCMMTNAAATPQFARETRLPCSACHSYVPRLNGFGQTFYNNGLRLPGQKKAITVPIRGQLTATAQTSQTGSRLPVGWNDIAVGSDGTLGNASTLYRIKWFPIARTLQIYALHALDKHLVLSAGKIAMLSQLDPELKIGLSTPTALAPAKSGAETPFAPAGDAMAIRFVGSTDSAMPYGDGWKLAATLPFSNELGPTSSPSRLREFDSTPKGLFVEVYRRQGLNSVGANAFFGSDGRRYQGLVFQREIAHAYLEGAVGHSETRDGSTTAYSLGLDVELAAETALGVRMDSQGGTTSLVALASRFLGGDVSLWQFIMESRFQAGDRPGMTLRLKFRF